MAKAVQIWTNKRQGSAVGWLGSVDVIVEANTKGVLEFTAITCPRPHAAREFWASDFEVTASWQSAIWCANRRIHRNSIPVQKADWWLTRFKPA